MNLILRIIFWQLEAKCFMKSYLIKTHMKSSHSSSLILRGHAAAKSLQLCLTLCDPIDGSPPSSPIPRILQARTLEWVAIFFPNAWKWKVKSEVTQSCPTLRDPMDCSLRGSSVHEIFQARVLEWGAITFSLRGHSSLQKWISKLLDKIACNFQLKLVSIMS